MIKFASTSRAGAVALLLGLVVLASGCGTVTEQIGSGTTSAIADRASTSTAQESANGNAQIDLLPPEADETTPDGLDAGDGDDSTDGGHTVGETDAIGDISARYSVVAQATVPQVIARSGPDSNAEPIQTFENPTASGSPLVFRSVDKQSQNSPDWIEVQLPIQPNGSTGWIPRADVALSDNPYRVEVNRGDYSLQVFHLNKLWLETPIAVGNGETPTPVGQFYLLELLSPSDPTGPYGPFAFGLSGFSEVLESFGGADTAIIGLHGTNDPSSLGTDVSHGCIRLENNVIEQLAEVLPLGTPVSIT